MVIVIGIYVEQICKLFLKHKNLIRFSFIFLYV